jgi:hypothetical protein
MAVLRGDFFTTDNTERTDESQECRTVTILSFVLIRIFCAIRG